MKTDKAILDANNNVVHEPDVLKWAKWHEEYRNTRRRIGRDSVGESDVSTVFLGLDHSFGGEPQIWFETLIFGGPHADWMERYATYDEAKRGHERVVARLRDGLAPE